MNELAKSFTEHKGLGAAIEELTKKYGKVKIKKTLERFDKIGVSPIIIPQRSKYGYFPNPLTLAREYMNSTD